MTVLVQRIRSAIIPVPVDDSSPRVLLFALFWISTALLAAALLVADPVFGSFVVGIPLFVAVLVRERGLAGIPRIMFGAAIGSSLVFGVFLGQNRGVFDDGVLIAGFVVFLVWASTYPIMLRQLDRQFLRERRSLSDEEMPEESARIVVIRVWMTLLAVTVTVAAIGHDLLGV